MEIIISLLSQEKFPDAKYQTFKITTGKRPSLLIHILSTNSNKLTPTPTKATAKIKCNPKKVEKIINTLHKEGLRPNGQTIKYLDIEKPSLILRKNKNAIFGTNGGFFAFYEDLGHVNYKMNGLSAQYGDPIGWLRFNQEDFGLPFITRPTILIFSDNTVAVKKINLLSGTLINKQTNVKICLRTKDKKDILTTPAYYTGLGETASEKKLRVGFVGNHVIDIAKPFEKIEVPINGFLVSLNPYKYQASDFHIFDKYEFRLYSTKRIKHAMSAGPTLIKNKKLIDNDIWKREDFSHSYPPTTLTKNIHKYRCARTAFIKYKGSKEYGIVVSEARTFGNTTGLTLFELATCISKIANYNRKIIDTCLYMDGGGCSSLCMRNKSGKIVLLNAPSGISNPKVLGNRPGEESEVGYALLLTNNK